jgi:hypothetical protein
MELELTKFVHVLLAIVAVGFNASYGIWLARAAKAPQATQSHVLRTIKFIDDRFANPAYGSCWSPVCSWLGMRASRSAVCGSRLPSASGSCW